MKKIMTIVAMLAVFGSAGLANAGDEIVFSAEDASPAIRVFNGYPYKITVATTESFDTNGTIVVVVYDSPTSATTNSFDAAAGLDTIAELATGVVATVNAESKSLLTLDINCSLAADVTTNTLLTATAATIMPGQWGTLTAWDTSKVKHFDAYMPSIDNGGSGNSKDVESIAGYIGGTGNITVNGYIQDSATGAMTLKYQKVIVSPVYVWGSMATNIFATTADSVGPGNIALTDWIAPVYKSQGVLVRASRATTATTGGIGITTKNK